MSIFIKFRYIFSKGGVPEIITGDGTFKSIDEFRQLFPNGRIIEHSPDGEYSSDVDGSAISDEARTVLNEPFPKGVEESVKRDRAKAKTKPKNQIGAEQIENMEIVDADTTPNKEKTVEKILAPITIAKTFMNNGIKFKIEESKLWKLDWVSVKDKEVNMEARAMDKEKKIINGCSIEVKVWTPVEEDADEK